MGYLVATGAVATEEDKPIVLTAGFLSPATMGLPKGDMYLVVNKSTNSC
jgi:hypothetical protein